MCRELISDIGLDAWVIIPSTDGQPRTVPVLDLLPGEVHAYGRVELNELYRT
jgi:hypothetical protein